MGRVSQKKESFFWTSYSDLMTSLFFIMLVLFILTIALLSRRVAGLNETLKKGKEIEKSIENIDSTYFTYDSNFKRHTLNNITVSFPTDNASITSIKDEDRIKLLEAGKAIRNFMINAKNNPELEEAQYLVILEGQSSRSKNYTYENDMIFNNDVLSYRRALALYYYWQRQGISFNDLPCELIVSGSGQNSLFREKEEERNQRFVIHIIPKPGVLTKRRQ